MEELTHCLVLEEFRETWENAPEDGVRRQRRRNLADSDSSVGSFCWTIWWRRLQEVSRWSRSGWTRNEGWQGHDPKLLVFRFFLILSVWPATSRLSHRHEEPSRCPTKCSEPFPDNFIRKNSVSWSFSPRDRGSTATGMMEARGLLGILGLFFLWITAQAQMKIPPET